MAKLMDLMLERKMFHVKLPSGLEIQASQYAFAPKPIVPAPFVAPPIQTEAENDITAPFQAFRPWLESQASAPAAPQPSVDPTDPESPVNDDALFASDLPLMP